MPKKFFNRFAPDAATLKQQPSLRWLGDSLEDPNIWHLNRQSVARAFLIGVIIAFQPIPMQMLAAAGAAFLFKANLPIAASLVWLTNPLTFAPIFYANYRIGAWMLGMESMTVSFEASVMALIEQLSLIWAPMVLGCTVAGVGLGAIAYFLVNWVWRWQVLSRWEERKLARQARTKSSSVL